MNRQTWLSERRAQAERSYTASAPTYDEREPSSPVHAAFVALVDASVDVGGTILNAACGTGRYTDAILDAGLQVVGIDQSAGMLEQARRKHPGVEVEQTGLQELAFRDAFDAAICIDAMEYVPPEDWPVVLGNLRRAVRPGGLVYLTVEEIDRAEVDRAYADAVEASLPVVSGEHHRRGGGYHFYPTRDQVTAWLAAARLEIVAEDTSPGTNYAYWHLLLRRAKRETAGHDEDVVASAWADHRQELAVFLIRSTRNHDIAEGIPGRMPPPAPRGPSTAPRAELEQGLLPAEAAAVAGGGFENAPSEVGRGTSALKCQQPGEGAPAPGGGACSAGPRPGQP